MPKSRPSYPPPDRPPILDRMIECRNKGKRGCTDEFCPFYKHCEMAKPYEEYARARAIPTLTDADKT